MGDRGTRHYSSGIFPNQPKPLPPSFQQPNPYRTAPKFRAHGAETRPRASCHVQVQPTQPPQLHRTLGPDLGDQSTLISNSSKFDVRHALLGALKLDPSEPNPASTSRIEAVEVHFTDVSGARMSICACIGLCAISIGRGEEVIGKLQGNLLYTGTGKLGMHVGEIVNINN